MGCSKMANEKRLIDANALDAKLDELMQRYAAQGRKEVAEDYNFVRTVLLTAPTVDAVEVVHGRWIPLEYDGYADGNPVWDLWECSECQEEHSGDEDTLTPYCPNCGAKMDGDGNG